MSQQLVKKKLTGGYDNVMPKSWIEAIKDKNTGQTLVEILQGFNMYFLPYNGNTSSTRCLVPTILRKKGLWITYVKYDGNVYTEWYAADGIDDTSWGNSSNWRIGNNTLVGDITISANGNWVINGTETEFKAVGEKGNTPLLRVANNKLQVSYDLGDTYIDVTNNPVYTKFRWLATTGDTQANNVGRIQASTDEGKTWTNMSNDFINNLHISKYIGADESLPTSGIAEGTIYAKGPTYDVADTSNANPIYRLWVYAWKGNTLAWQDNGEFTSIAAGIVQEMGSNENAVMSQKATSEAIHEVSYYIGIGKDLTINSNIPFYGADGTIYRNTNRKKIIVPVNEGDRFYCSIKNTSNIYSIAALDSSKSLIQAESVAGNVNTKYTVPSGVSYLCFCSLNDGEYSGLLSILKESDLSNSFNSLSDRIDNNSDAINDNSNEIALRAKIQDVEIINIFDKTKYELGYINNTGTIVPNVYGGYAYFKFNLAEGDYMLDIVYTGTQQVMWKYTDSTYSTPQTQIIGNVASYNNVIHLDGGYYAISLVIEDLPYNPKLIALAGAKEINNLLSRALLDNAFRNCDIITRKYINSSGVISNADSSYHIVKLHLNSGEYILHSPGSDSSRTLWKYTDSSYSSGEEIIGSSSSEFTKCVNLLDGYYVFAWSGSNKAFLLNAEIFNNILSESSVLLNLRDTLYKSIMVTDNDFIQGNYIQATEGMINSNSEYYITDFFEVNKNQKIVAANFGGSGSVAKIAAYDENKKYLKDNSFISDDEIDIYYSVPNEVKYLRFCCSKKEAAPFVKLLNDVEDIAIDSKIGSSLAGNDASRKHADSLNDGTLQINDYPIALKKGNDMSVMAYITTFGNGITMGYGGNIDYGKYIKINGTNVIIYRYDGEVIQEESVAHNLDIETFIKVAMRHQDNTLIINIISLKGVFTYTYENWGNAIKGVPFVKVDATTSLTNVDLSITNSDFRCAVWAFGDSYFHYHTPTTIMYWMREWRLDNMLVDGYGGESANKGMFDLTMALKHGSPKYIVWCLGMNGDYAVWEKNYNKLKMISNALGSTLILCTIPVPGNTSYVDKQQITNAVRNSGYRYIDAYKAVGANENGQWYGNGTDYDYQGGDRIHPSIYGARAIASQWLIDFPEIMQYSK